MGVATRPLVDLTTPLAPGRAGVPARRCPRLSGRGSPPGFRVCSTTALGPAGRPVNRGAYPSPATGRERSPGIAPCKKAPDWVPFCMELTSHQLGKFAPGNRFFRFSYVQPKQIRNHIIIYWIKAFYEIRFAIQEPVTSLVRGHEK